MQQPAWLAAAWAEFGVREISGEAASERIKSYFRNCGHGEIASDETPWCAAFVGAMLARTGLAHTGSLLARSYLDHGAAMDDPVPGAIAVLSRGSEPWAGHVGFYLGAADGKIILLGGNQGDAVSVAAFDAARLLGYRWPDEASVPEASPPRASAVTDVFEQALAHVLAMEGGFSDDPYDAGGPTNKGITLAVFAKWRGATLTASTRKVLVADLKSVDDATVTDIYRARYWQPASCALLPAGVAVMHFDCAVNQGVGTANRLLQTALAVGVDGEIGPQTLSAVRAQVERTIVERYGDLRRARYRTLRQFWRFGRGWLRRVDDTESLALSLAAAGPAAREQAKGVEMMDDEFTQPLPGQIPGEPMAGTPAATTSSGEGKWWLESKTLWGTLITALSTVLPVIGPLLGINLPADIIKTLGDQSLLVIQAITGLVGTILAIYGRTTAQQPLMRRGVRVKM